MSRKKVEKTNLRRERCVLALLLLVVCVGPVGAQDAAGRVRVHVLPVANRSGNGQFDAVAETVTGTVALTLRLLDAYGLSVGPAPEEVRTRLASDDPEVRSAALADLAAQLDVENVVFGDVLPPSESDVPRIRLSVFDRLTGAITVDEERRPDSLFDVFAATDTLIADVLSGFSGRRVAFGTIRIEPQVTGDGEGPAYEVTLDGEPMGAGVRSIDSVLTGSHRVVIAGTVLGERRVFLDQLVSVEEGTVTRLNVSLPSVTAAEEAAAVAQRQAEAELSAILSQLASISQQLSEERRQIEAASRDTIREIADGWSPVTAGVGIAARAFLNAESYLDPVAVRAAAGEVGRAAAALHLARGRALLAVNARDAGVAEFSGAAEVATLFGADDVWGSAATVDDVLGTWAAGTVRRERRPRTVWPVALVAASVGIIAGNTVTEAIEQSAQGQAVPMVPVLFATSFAVLWNSLDWDGAGAARALRRFGRRGDIETTADISVSKWEIDVGLAAVLVETEWVVQLGDAAFPLSPILLKEQGQRLTPALTVRRRLAPGHAVELDYTPSIGTQASTAVFTAEEWTAIDAVPLSPSQEESAIPGYTGMQSATPIDLSVHWSYSRVGTWYLRTGIGYSWALLGPSDQFSNDEQLQAAERVFGTNPQLSIWSWKFGVGRRIGFDAAASRSEPRPWHVSAQYRLDAFRPPGQMDSGELLYSHGLEVQLKRSISLAASTVAMGSDARVAVAESPPEELTPQRALDRHRWRWRPSRLALFADAGGLLSGGARTGVEVFLGSRWSASLYVRMGAGPNIYDQTLDDTVLWPAVSTRFYPMGTRTTDGRPRAGWFLGAAGEYSDLTNAKHEIGTADPSGILDTLQITGDQLFVLRVEGGRRFRVGRSGFLDVGGQIGRGFGVVREEGIRYDGDLNTVTNGGEMGGNKLEKIWWPSLVLAAGVAVY